MKRLIFILIVLVFFLCGCVTESDPRINVREDVGSDNLVHNVVTKPVMQAFSALLGEGIQINQAVLRRRGNSGFMELYVMGYNNSYDVRRFEYRVEWLDSEGMLIDTKASVWQRYSVMGKSNFRFKVTAPRTEAVDFRMNTRLLK